MADRRDDFQAHAVESLQETLDRGEPDILASYGLIGSIFLLGGGGYLLDRWLDTSPVLLVIGLLLGTGLGLYGLARRVWQRR